MELIIITKTKKIMNQNVIFGELDFNGNLIQLTQSTGFDMMVNATEMWKSYGKLENKRPHDWLKQSGTQEYLQHLRSRMNQNYPELMKSEGTQNPFTPVLTIKGSYSDGTRQGTWMHRWVAIRYAQWLDPRFAVWIDMKIDELLQNGFTTALQEERDRYNAILPQANYCNQVLQTSENLYSSEQLCKDLELGMSSKRLIGNLIRLGFAYRRQDGKWFLSRDFDSLRYMKTTTILDKKTKKPRNVRRWTELGKHWIWSLKGVLQ